MYGPQNKRKNMNANEKKVTLSECQHGSFP